MYSYDRRAAIPCGECFSWAYREVRESGGILVHAKVSFWGKTFDHAWIEKGGKVYDWQTMVAGFGGKFRGKGYPEAVYAELWQPSGVKVFNKTEALVASARAGHYGPW